MPVCPHHNVLVKRRGGRSIKLENNNNHHLLYIGDIESDEGIRVWLNISSFV
jgi:hypothetical protein